HPDIRDHVFAFVVLAFEAQPQDRSDRRTRAIGGQHIVGLETVMAGGGTNIERNAVGAAIQRVELGLPTHVDQIAAGYSVMQKLLDILLLKVVHGQVLFAAWVRHLEPEDFLAAVVAAAKSPAERLLDEWRDSSDPLQNMHA